MDASIDLVSVYKELPMPVAEGVPVVYMTEMKQFTERQLAVQAALFVGKLRVPIHTMGAEGKVTVMRTDADIQKDVMDQLKWEPFLNAEQLGVAVKNGIVTLSGIVDSYSKKIGAELAARKVVGVRIVAEEIQVGSSPLFDRTDTEIAEGILNALKWHTAVPEELLKIKVEKGVVSLEGEVKWNFQREAAVNAVKNLAGVRSVNNYMTIRSVITPDDVREKISASLARHAVIDAEKIRVELSGNRVVLSGTVRSLAEKDDAEHAAWSAPGVAAVDNRLTVAVGEGDLSTVSIL